MEMIEETGFKYLGILEVDKLMENEWRKLEVGVRHSLRLNFDSELKEQNKIAANNYSVTPYRWRSGTPMTGRQTKQF